MARWGCGVAVIGAVLVCMVGSATAWGPVTHYAMTCSGAKATQGVAQCANDPSNGLLMVGSDLPDAFYFVRACGDGRVRGPAEAGQ